MSKRAKQVGPVRRSRQIDLISYYASHPMRTQHLPQHLANVLARTELADQLSGFRWFRMARLHIDHLDHSVAPSVYIFRPFGAVSALRA